MSYFTLSARFEFFVSSESATNPEGTFQMENFSSLLEKLNIKLSKDTYIRLVDSNMEALRVDPSAPISHSTAVQLYCRVYAPCLKFGSRMRTAAGRSDTALVTELASRGCDFNSADGNGHTPLHHACFYGQKEMIKCLHALSDKNQSAKVRAPPTIFELGVTPPDIWNHPAFKNGWDVH